MKRVFNIFFSILKERIVKFHGSQCGFCTPGIVMSMHVLLRNNPLPTHKEMESAFEGMKSFYSIDLFKVFSASQRL